MAHHFYGTESQPYNNLLSNKFSNLDARNGPSASPWLSQPALTQRSAAAGLHNSGSQPSMSQLGPFSQQQGFSGHARTSGLSQTPNQPALSGVFRPGSAPHADLKVYRPSSSQMDPTASQWSQQPAGNMLGVSSSMHAPSGLAGNPNSGPAGHHHAAGSASGSSLLCPKPLPLLRVPGGGASSLASQLQHRPGSAPGLLTGGAAPTGMQQQHSLLGMSHRIQQQQQQQQQRGLSGLGLTSGSQQQQGLGLLSGGQPPQQLDLLGHASQGAGNQGFGDYDSAATEPPATLLGSQQQQTLQLLPLGDAGRGRDGAVKGFLQGTEHSQAHQQQRQQATTTAAASPARPPAAATARHADDSAAAAASPAAAAAAGADLAQRINSLQECCSCMNKIVTHDIPVLLQQQTSTQDSLQALAESSSRKLSALEARMTVLADSVASFMDGFQAWQQEQQQRQQQRDSEQQWKQVVLSNMACQTTPSIAGGQPAGCGLQRSTAAAPAAAATAHVPALVRSAAVTSPAATRHARHSSSLQLHGGSTAGTPAAAAVHPERPSPQQDEEPFGGYAAHTAARAALQLAAPSPEKRQAPAAHDVPPPATVAAGTAASGKGRGPKVVPAAPPTGKSKQPSSLVQSKLNFCRNVPAAGPAACTGMAAASIIPDALCRMTGAAAGKAPAATATAAAPAEQQTPWFTKRSGSSNSSAKKQAAAASGGSVAAAASGRLAGSTSQGRIAAAADGSAKVSKPFVQQQQQQQMPPMAPRQFQRRANSTTASVAAAGSTWQGAASKGPSHNAAQGAGVVACRTSLTAPSSGAVAKPASRTVSAAAAAPARAAGIGAPRRSASTRVNTRAGAARAAAAAAAAAGQNAAAAAAVGAPISARPFTAKRSRPQTARPAAAAKPAGSSALMLFGEMDSDSLDNVAGDEEEQATEQRHQLQHGGGAMGEGSFAVSGGASPSNGISGRSRESNTAASGAGAGRGRFSASAAGGPAGSCLAGNQLQRKTSSQQQQQQQQQHSMLVDDDELARQVAAQMARHRNKRMRASQSRSQMG